MDEVLAPSLAVANPKKPKAVCFAILIANLAITMSPVFVGNDVPMAIATTVHFVAKPNMDAAGVTPYGMKASAIMKISKDAKRAVLCGIQNARRDTTHSAAAFVGRARRVRLDGSQSLVHAKRVLTSLAPSPQIAANNNTMQGFAIKPAAKAITALGRFVGDNAQLICRLIAVLCVERVFQIA